MYIIYNDPSSITKYNFKQNILKQNAPVSSSMSFSLWIKLCFYGLERNIHLKKVLFSA